jgi:hemerythrin
MLQEKDLPLVDMDFMNNTHKEELVLINTIVQNINDYENIKNTNLINKNYQAWKEHTIKHFEAEEIMMLEKKFPPYLMHKGIHDIELKKIDFIFNEWKDTNDINILKNYFENELPKWLINHIETMDTITARFFKSGSSPCSLQN